MLPALLNAGVQEGIGFVDFTKAVQHFWQLRRIDGLNGNLDNGLGVELQRPKDVELLVAVQIVGVVRAWWRSNGSRTGFCFVKPVL